MHKGIKTRFIIHQILNKLKASRYGYDEIYKKTINEQNFSQSDRNMIQNVVLNSMRYHLHCDQIIKQYVKKKTNTQTHLLLLSAITQLVFLDFKDYAVVNSTVELAKGKTIKVYPGFINAVLKKIQKDKVSLKNISVKYFSLPNWFTKETENLELNNKKVFIKNIITRPDLHLVFKNSNLLKKFNFNCQITSEISCSIKNPKNIENLPYYDEGNWWVQDFSAMLPIYLSKELKGKKAIDLCSAPGGKSFQMLSLNAKLKILEKNKYRGEILKKNLKRLRFNNEIFINDALDIDTNEKYEVVLVDAPCSSVGTIRRNPEIFFSKKKPNFKKLVKLQKQLLDKAKKLVSVNGIIIYMVCSFLDIETTIPIKNFLKNNLNYKIKKFKSINNLKFINNEGFIKSLPINYNNTNIDGFFAAKLKRYD